MKCHSKYFFALIGVLVFTMLFNTISAQDGEKLFKANCAACHKPDKSMVGPALKGKKDAWVQAGEADLLYEWVKNSAKLIESGTSKMAEIAKDYDPSVMTNQLLSNAEIDAVFEYVQDFVPKATAVVDPNAEPIDYFANKGKVIDGWTPDTNRMIFWVQFVLMCLLIFGIFIISKSIQSVVEVSNRNKKLLGLLILAGGFLSSNSAMAFELTMESEHFVNVNSDDNLVFLGINVILLGIFMYMKNVLNNITNAYYPEIEEARQKSIALSTASKKSVNVLTQMVPMEEEKSILLDHDYDGIQELDNHLPPWWVWSFYASIIFAFYYIITHHVIQTTPDNITLYEQSMDEAEKQKDAYIASLGDLWITEDNVSLLVDDNSLEIGQEIFIEKCSTCHMADGSGQTGPNLTDKYWIYGGAIESMFNVVKYGAKGGMPSHERSLTGKEIQQVTSYVMSMPEQVGKPPQGQEYIAPKKEEAKEDSPTEAEDEVEEMIDDGLQAANQ